MWNYLVMYVLFYSSMSHYISACQFWPKQFMNKWNVCAFGLQSTTSRMSFCSLHLKIDSVPTISSRKSQWQKMVKGFNLSRHNVFALGSQSIINASRSGCRNVGRVNNLCSESYLVLKIVAYLVLWLWKKQAYLFFLFG